MEIFSISRLRKFEECPRAYKFRYIEKPEVERIQNIYGFLGSRVHETLEKHYTDLMDGFCNSIDDLLGYYNKIWSENWSEDILVYGNRSVEEYKEDGKNCITNYYSCNEPFEEDTTIDTELNLRCSLEAYGENYDFQGYIDRLSKGSNGSYEIHDYKTSKNIPSHGELEENRQLGLYQIAVQQNYPDAEEIELVWHYVRYGEEFRFKKTEENLRRLKINLVRTVRKVERAKKRDIFPAKRFNGARCDWCDYQHLCEAWSKDRNAKIKRKLEDFL